MGKKIIEIIKDFFQVGITAIIVVFICFKFLFISAQVHGTSMYPTLQTNDRGFSFVLTKNIGIERFDICVIDGSILSICTSIYKQTVIAYNLRNNFTWNLGYCAWIIIGGIIYEICYDAISHNKSWRIHC